MQCRSDGLGFEEGTVKLVCDRSERTRHGHDVGSDVVRQGFTLLLGSMRSNEADPIRSTGEFGEHFKGPARDNHDVNAFESRDRRDCCNGTRLRGSGQRVVDERGERSVEIGSHEQPLG